MHPDDPLRRLMVSLVVPKQATYPSPKKSVRGSGEPDIGFAGTAGASGDAADHIVEARRRAREVLGGEANLSDADDWRRVLVSARDEVILLSLVWVALLGFGHGQLAPWILIALSFGVALVTAVSLARSTYLRVQYFVSELERERREIREHFDLEVEEVRALYAAKGFHEPLLSEVVETLSADEDRLLKIMMEEELGLSMHHIQHPMIVGATNFLAAVAAGLAFSLPMLWFPAESAPTWILIVGVMLLLVIAALSAWASRRAFVEFAAASLLLSAVSGGTVYLLTRWFAQWSGMVGDA